VKFQFFNPNYYSLFIALLFLIFTVLSNITLPGRPYGETGYVEISQVIIIVSILIMGFIRKRYLVSAYSRSTYWLRQSMVGLLLFEEISYLTTNKFAFLGYNSQSELNFHNSSFLTESLVSFDILGKDSVDLTPQVFIIIFSIIFLYAGDRIPFLKRFNIIYLHPLVRVGIVFFLFSDYYGFLKRGFQYLFRNLFFFSGNFSTVNPEFSELFLYIIFC